MSASHKTPARGLGRSFIRVLLFWNPVLTAGLTLYISPPSEFLRAFPISFLIANVVMCTSFALVGLVRGGEERIAAARGRAAMTHGTGWYFALSVLTMPLGLWLAFRTAELVFGIHRFTLSGYRTGLTFGAVIAGGFFLWETRRDAREAAQVAALRLRETEARALTAQLAALTAQLNPHLLFNALNTIAALVHDDPDRAEEVTVRLASLYRSVLAATQRPTCSLEDELKLSEAYLYVEQARFGDRLRVTIDVPADLRRATTVPSLLVQPLVENALKHGIAPRAQGGTLRIVAREEAGVVELSIEDDGVGLGAAATTGSGTGVANTRARLALFYGERATLALDPRDGGGTRAVLRLPREASEAAA